MPSESPALTNPGEPDWVALLRAQVENLRFGVVQLVVHDGRVIQIERTEKLRLPNGGVETSRAKISL
jgi:hypothetical protein